METLEIEFNTYICRYLIQRRQSQNCFHKRNAYANLLLFRSKESQNEYQEEFINFPVKMETKQRSRVYP